MEVPNYLPLHSTIFKTVFFLSHLDLLLSIKESKLSHIILLFFQYWIVLSTFCALSPNFPLNANDLQPLSEVKWIHPRRETSAFCRWCHPQRRKRIPKSIANKLMLPIETKAQEGRWQLPKSSIQIAIHE